MNPYTGELYASRQAAVDNGVESPVEIIGDPDDVLRVSRALAAAHKAKMRRKMAQKSRRNNR